MKKLIGGLLSVFLLFSVYLYAQDMSGLHSLLGPSKHRNTTAGEPTRGDIITGQGSPTTWKKLAKGSIGTFLQYSGTDLTISAWTFPLAITAGDLLYGSGLNSVTSLAASSQGKFLQMGASLPAYSAYTMPATLTAGSLLYASTTGIVSPLAIGTSGKIVVSDGTNPVWSDTINISTIQDTVSIVDDGDATKKFQFQTMYLGTGTTKTAEVPNRNFTFDYLTLASGTNLVGALVGNGTTISAVAPGALNNVLLSNGSIWTSGALSGLPAGGATGKLLRYGASDPAWSTLTYPDTAVIGDFMYASAANTITARRAGTAGQVIASTGTTPDYTSTLYLDTMNMSLATSSIPYVYTTLFTNNTQGFLTYHTTKKSVLVGTGTGNTADVIIKKANTTDVMSTANALVKFNGTTGDMIKESTITEDGTNLSLGALNLVTTGTMLGALKFLAVTDNIDALAHSSIITADAYGSMIELTATKMASLPFKAQGMATCVIVTGLGISYVQPQSTDHFTNTRDMTAGYRYKSEGNTGDFMCFVGSTTANKWRVMGTRGVWTDNAYGP